MAQFVASGVPAKGRRENKREKKNRKDGKAAIQLGEGEGGGSSRCRQKECKAGCGDLAPYSYRIAEERKQWYVSVSFGREVRSPTTLAPSTHPWSGEHQATIAARCAALTLQHKVSGVRRAENEERN